jgi:hypothetical protein
MLIIVKNYYKLIVGTTLTGRARVETLQLDLEECINLRWALFVFGKHPPSAVWEF